MPKIELFGKEKGTVLMVALITFVLMVGLSGAYLSITTSQHQNTQFIDKKIRSRYIADAGLQVAVGYFKSLATKPSFAKDENNTTTNREQPPSVSYPEFSTGTWAKYANWRTGTFANGQYTVDFYVERDPTDTTKMAQNVFWCTGVYNDVRSTVVLTYKVGYNSTQPPSLGDDIGAFGIQIDPTVGDSLKNNQIPQNIPILFSGVKSEIKGQDHEPGTSTQGNNGPPSSSNASNGTYAISSNIEIPYNIDAHSASQTDSNLSPANNNQAAYKGETLDNIISYVESNHDYSYTGNTTLSGNLDIGSNTDDSSGYKKVYMDLTDGGTVDGGSIHATGNVTGFGLLVIKVNDPTQTIWDNTGNFEWNGLVIVKVSGSCANMDQTFATMSGTPKVVGAMVVYFDETVTDFAFKKGSCVDCDDCTGGKVSCSECNGTGHTPAKSCSNCGGDGLVACCGNGKCAHCNNGKINPGNITCNVCGGTGNCVTCGGTKTKDCPVCVGGNIPEGPCPACNGSGEKPCNTCGGSGTISENSKTINAIDIKGTPGIYYSSKAVANSLHGVPGDDETQAVYSMSHTYNRD